jgi:hypothetical protein
MRAADDGPVGGDEAIAVDVGNLMRPTGPI